MNKTSPLNITLTDRKAGVTITEWVYDVLRHAVMCGQILPGRSLTLRELAKVLEVSPMPIRVALKRLSSERALEVKENRRIIVPTMTAMKFNELCETRISLETHAAIRALPYVDSVIMAQLEALDDNIDYGGELASMESNITHNHAFHRMLYTANPHQISLPLIESLWLQLGPFLRLSNEKMQGHFAIDRHKEALIAIRQKNPLALQLAIAADIREGFAFVGTPELLHQFLEESAESSQ